MINTVLSTDTQTCHWKYSGRELADPQLFDQLVLSLCDSFGINHPHFELQLLITELMSNAIDHGVLSLDSSLKDSCCGYERYFIERKHGLDKLTHGTVSVCAQWIGNSLLSITVEDSGQGFDFSGRSLNPNLYSDLYPNLYANLIDSEGQLKFYGRGLTIISGLCQSVVHYGCGNCTVVEFKIV